MKAHRPSSRAGGAARAAIPSQPKVLRHILVVEDEPDICQLDTEVLRESGYQVDTAESGFVALNSLKTNHYDLLIIEEELSMMTGLELVEELGSQAMKIPIILVSGVMRPTESTGNSWPNVRAVLVKPYTVAQLLHKVGEVLLPPKTLTTGDSLQLRLPRL